MINGSGWLLVGRAHWVGRMTERTISIVDTRALGGGQGTVKSNQSGAHTGLCRRPTASGDGGCCHFLHLPLLQRRQSVVLAAGEGGGGVKLGKPVEEKGHGSEREVPIRDRTRTTRQSLSRGNRRRKMQTGREMWITCVFRDEGVASDHSITAVAARRSRCCPARNGQRTIGERIRDEIRHSNFSNAAQRPVCSWPEQHLIVRVRLRDRSSALMGAWPVAGLAGTSLWTNTGPLFVPLRASSHRLGSRAHDSTQPADQRRNNPSGQGQGA